MTSAGEIPLAAGDHVPARVAVLDSPDGQLLPLMELLGQADVPVDYQQLLGDVEPTALHDATIIVTESARISSDLIQQLPGLRLVIRAGIGVDIIDVPAAKARGVSVANVPHFCVEEVADHTLLLILAVIRRLGAYRDDVQDGVWPAPIRRGIRRISALTIGVVGLGGIGTRVVERLRGFGCSILVHDPYVILDHDAGVENVPLDRLFAESDVISLHCPLTDQTRGMLSGDRLSLNVKAPYVINVSRGDLIDLPALDSLITTGCLSGAAVDVLPGEPWPDLSQSFVRRPEVLVTPHVAWLSDEAIQELNESVYSTIQHYVRHGRLPREVEVS